MDKKLLVRSSFFSARQGAAYGQRMGVGVSLRQCGTKGACGPLCLGAPLHAICTAYLRRGAPEPLRLVCCMSGEAGSRSLRKLG